ncbi:MAG: hypothetical protein KGL39_08615 [Patescibacteria group bacterium]|nr:hypothetical protein [Patescibacteria group bacterium]
MPRPATQTEVNTGAAGGMYVTPTTLNGYPWVATNLSPATMTNVAYLAAQTVAETNVVNVAQLPNRALRTEFNVKDFGAYGDAQTALGALAVSNSTSVTVTGGHFVSGDAGDFICFKGADVNRVDYWTTIATVVDTTHITVAAPVPVSYNLALPGNVAAMWSGYSVRYGAHDDSAAFQAMLSQNTNGGALYFVPPGVYLILNPPTNNNAQLLIPQSLRSIANAAPKCEIFGERGSLSGTIEIHNDLAYDPNTTVILSDLGTAANPGQWENGIPSSVLSDCGNGPLYPGGPVSQVLIPSSGFYVTNTTIMPNLHDLAFESSYDAGCITLNFLGGMEATMHDVIVGTFYETPFCPAPLNTNGWGIVQANNFGGSAGICDYVFVGGFHNGIDLGLMQGNYDYFQCCSNALTALFTGGTTEAPLRNIQFTDCPRWLLGSGDADYYSPSGNAAAGIVPRIDVLDYQSTVIGEGLPDWMTNAPVACYDPSNSIAKGGINTPPAWIRYGEFAQSGPKATWVNGGWNNYGAAGTPPNIFQIIERGGGYGEQSTIPMTFGSSATFTNGLTVTNVGTFLVDAGNAAYYAPIRIGQDGDFVVQNFSASPGRKVSWLAGIDDRLNSPTNNFVLLANGGPNTGIGGYGSEMVLDPWGNLKTYGNIASIDGKFIGDGSGLTNISGGGGGASVTNPVFYGTLTVNGPTNGAAIYSSFLGSVDGLNYTLMNNGGTIDGMYWGGDFNTGVDPYGSGDLVFGTQHGGANTIGAGFNNTGVGMVYTTNADLHVWHNISSANGSFYGNASGLTNYPPATSSSPGIVQPDGTTITVSGGVLTAVGGGGATNGLTWLQSSNLSAAITSTATNNLPPILSALTVQQIASAAASTNTLVTVIRTNNSTAQYFGVPGGNVGTIYLADSWSPRWDPVQGASNGVSVNGHLSLPSGSSYFGNASFLTNGTPMSSLGPNSMPGSNTVAAMITALAPSGGGGSNNTAVVSCAAAFSYATTTNTASLYGSLVNQGLAAAPWIGAIFPFTINSANITTFNEFTWGGYPVTFYLLTNGSPAAQWTMIMGQGASTNVTFSGLGIAPGVPVAWGYVTTNTATSKPGSICATFGQ